VAWSIFQQGGGPEVAVGWALELLKLMGAPRTPGNIEFIYQWEKSEGGGGRYNPLNQGDDPGHPTYTTTGSQYGGGAADYASWQAGLYGARDYLNMPAFQPIRDAMIANKPAQARVALWASPWAASHYGGGADWYSGTVPGGNPVLPPAGTGAATLTSASQTISAQTMKAGCLIAIPGIVNPVTNGLSSIPFIGSFVHSTDVTQPVCLLSKSNARAFLGAGLMLAGSIIVLVGLGVATRDRLRKDVPAAIAPNPKDTPAAAAGEAPAAADAAADDAAADDAALAA
jgi:hypothetical protein